VFFLNNKSTDIYGVVGIVQLCRSTYLFVITERVFAAHVQSHKIWRVQQVEAINISPCATKEDLTADALDSEFLESILAILNSGKMLYSTTYDLTHSLQHGHLALIAKGDTVVDDRYWFNKAISTPIIEVDSAGVNPWIMKIIAGDAGEIDLPDFNGSSFKTTIIARLSTLRLGTRYSLFHSN
jgi:hypothetical protein